MTANQWGRFFSITSFGESHGPALGVVIDGCPSGVLWRPEILTRQMARRRPGSSAIVSGRMEKDEFELLSGVYGEKTLGTPIALLVRNQDARSEDYTEIATQPRIGHADDTWKTKFSHVDPRGGGRSSGRETVSRVMAGAVAEMLMTQAVPKLSVCAWAQRLGPFQLSQEESQKIRNTESPQEMIESTPTRFPSSKSSEVQAFLEKAREQGESYGGSIGVRIKNPKAGWGEPVFHKLKADLAAAMLTVGATWGFELGANFSAEESGQEFHQAHHSEKYGGIRGGISTGEDIFFSVHFKPTSSIKDIAKKGRHDPCIVPRAVPVVEAMTWLVLADHWMAHRLSGNGPL